MTGKQYYDAIVASVKESGHYFKATQPDGYSFMGSPKKLYAVGDTVTPDGDGTRLCREGLLHVANTPGEVLVGGSWPCKLFEVRGEIVAGFDGEHPHKGGAKSLQVVRELPAWIALGTNGRAVAAFHALLPTLSAAAWDAVCAAAWDAAWAMSAILAADLITDEQFKTLYAPFEPHLPIATVRANGIEMFPVEIAP